MMLKYRLVAVDLDGTLLDSQGCVSDYTKTTIDEYQKLGGFFTLATGRMEASARKFARELNVNAPLITFNGGKVVSVDGETVLSEEFIDTKSAIRTYDALVALNMDMVLYINGAPYITTDSDVILKYIDRIKANRNKFENFANISEPCVNKILVVGVDLDIELIRRTANDVGGITNCVSSDAELFEILPDNVSKDRGLIVVAEHLGIPMAEVIAVGDHFNDISMINAAGLGVAVQSAVDGALAAADYITSSNDEDGVAKVIRKVIDGEL